MENEKELTNEIAEDEEQTETRRTSMPTNHRNLDQTEVSNTQESHAAHKNGADYLNQGRYQAAIQYLSLRIIKGDQSVEAYCNLGLAYFKQAQQQPMKQLDEAFQNGDPRAFGYPSCFYLWNIQDPGFEQTLKYLKQLLQMHPDDAEAYAFRGNLFHSLEEPDKAIEDYSEAIRLNPTYADAYNKRSQAHFELDEYQEAADDAGEAIRLDSRLPLAYVNRAKASAALGRVADSEADIACATELGADCTDIFEFVHI